MNTFDEIRNRWFRVHEQKTDAAKATQISKIDPATISNDVKTLQDRITHLEGEVNQLYNKTSSRFGPLVNIEDGILHYRLNGLFVKLTTIHAALKFLYNLLLNDSALVKKFRQDVGVEEEIETMSIFKEFL